MVRLFDRFARNQDAADQLARLRQAGQSVTEYAIQFKTLAASCDWNQGACRSMFHAGLEEEIQDELATIDLPQDFDDLINMALRVEVLPNRNSNALFRVFVSTVASKDTLQWLVR